MLEIVAAQTGYPPDMLDMDLDLEADLGIDTVKQAETFAAVREAYDIPRDENLKLRDFPTLAHVVQFVFDRKPELQAATSQPAAASESGSSEAAGDNPVQARVLEIVAAQTGYPPDMLDMDLDLEADLGIDTVKQAETFAAVREAYDIPREENLRLRDFPTLAHVVQFVFDRKPDLAASGQASTDAPSPQAAAKTATTQSLPRREAVATLRPALDACAPTASSSAKEAESWSCSIAAESAQRWSSDCAAAASTRSWSKGGPQQTSSSNVSPTTRRPAP